MKKTKLSKLEEEHLRHIDTFIKAALPLMKAALTPPDIRWFSLKDHKKIKK